MIAEEGEERAPGQPARQAARVVPVLTVCSLIYLLDALVHSIIGPLAPQMEASLAIGHAQMGSVFSANLIGQCIGLLVFPLLAGRIGNRNVVVITAAGFGVFQLASGFADGWQSLFALRLLTGLFLGGAMPTCLAMVTAIAAIRRRGFTIMVLFTGYGLGATLAGLAVEFFGESGWRNAMVAVGVCCLLTAILAWVWLRPSQDIPGQSFGTLDEATGNPFAVFAPHYLLGTAMLWLLFISMLTISYCLNSWLPILLVEVGHDQSVAAIAVTTFSLGGIVAALGVGLMIDRWGATPVLVSFLAISTILLFVIGQLLETAGSGILLLLLGVCGFFVLGAYGGVNVVLASFYPAALRTIGIGWTKSVGRVGTVIAPILIGFALTNGVGETTVMSLFAVPAGLAALATFVIGLSARFRARADAVLALQVAAE